MLKAILFDLDGTLLDRDTSVKEFAAAQYDRLALHLNHIPKLDYVTRFIELDGLILRGARSQNHSLLMNKV